MKAAWGHCAVLLSLLTAATAQTTIVGSKDYGLASSSVMWMPRGSSIFLNPAELGRLHQNEFLFNTNRFRSMASMTGAFSFPFMGTVAGGVSNQDSLTTYTLGYGRLLGSYHTFGLSASVISKIQSGFRYSAGTALHFPFSSENSGIHIGASAANLPKETILNGGIGLWLLTDWLRVQASAQNRIHRAMTYGAEFLASDDFSFLFGSRAFKKYYGGISYNNSTFTADLAAGPAGLTFSLNIIIGDAAEDQRSLSYEEGYNLYSEKRYSEALQKFLLAMEYDEYDDDSRMMVEDSRSMLDSVETTNMRQAKQFEERFDYPSAIHSYAAVIRANPSNTAAETLLVHARKKLGEFVSLLIVVGDSLKNRKEAAGARKNYELALKYDPGNDIASSRVDELENLSKENVKSILVRAQAMLNKKQFDNAQKEYERALSLEPNNSRAKAGLNAIQQKRNEEQVEVAKAVFDQGKYFDALVMMLELSKQNIKSRELESYIETAREKLQPEVEKRFKQGLAYYVSENYDHAITVWDNALLIQPRHAGMLEYRKRAEEKMKALEKLK